MEKQITYVIVNHKGELYAGYVNQTARWTPLIIDALLFDNDLLAVLEHEKYHLVGMIMKMKYTLEPVM